MFYEERTVHISDVMSFKRCRRLWNWSSRYRMNLEPAKPVSHFFIGRAFHHCVEELTSDGTEPRLALASFLKDELKRLRAGPLWNLIRPDIREYVRLTRSLMEQYVAWVALQEGAYADQYLDYLAHEMSFGDGHTEPIPIKVGGRVLEPVVYVAGKFDGLVHHRPKGVNLLKEYKTCRSLEERMAQLSYDEQATFYVYSAQELLGERVDGVLYTLVRKKIPSEPRMLNSGFLSTAKSIDTTPAAYRAAIRRVHGSDVTETFIQKHYGDILDHLKHFGPPYVQRIRIKRTPEQIENYLREVHAVACEMLNPDTVLYATREFGCTRCHFFDPCGKQDLGDTEGVNFAFKYEYAQRASADAPELAEA